MPRNHVVDVSHVGPPESETTSFHCHVFRVELVRIQSYPFALLCFVSFLKKNDSYEKKCRFVSLRFDPIRPDPVQSDPIQPDSIHFVSFSVRFMLGLFPFACFRFVSKLTRFKSPHFVHVSLPSFLNFIWVRISPAPPSARFDLRFSLLLSTSFHHVRDHRGLPRFVSTEHACVQVPA